MLVSTTNRAFVYDVPVEAARIDPQGRGDRLDRSFVGDPALKCVDIIADPDRGPGKTIDTTRVRDAAREIVRAYEDANAIPVILAIFIFRKDLRNHAMIGDPVRERLPVNVEGSVGTADILAIGTVVDATRESDIAPLALEVGTRPFVEHEDRTLDARGMVVTDLYRRGLPLNRPVIGEAARPVAKAG